MDLHESIAVNYIIPRLSSNVQLVMCAKVQFVRWSAHGQVGFGDERGGRIGEQQLFFGWVGLKTLERLFTSVSEMVYK